ncbi:MAG: sugar transferase [Candidatus Bipolaricaulota bacterium]
MLKRLLDFSASLTGLMVVFPIMVVIGLWIRLDSKGPIFYRGTRVGKDGKEFHMLKLRTMVINADRLGGPSTSDDDPRLTKAGKQIRRYNLDELPQLINVLKGDMSIVGPRPEVPEEVEQYTEEEKALLSVRPGMTDYASIEFNNEGEILRGSKDPHQAYREVIRPEKIRLGLEYVNTRSVYVDFKIIFKTLVILLRRSGLT